METVRFSSPVGLLSISAEDDAITEITFADDIEKGHPPSGGVLSACCNQLREYFEGKRTEFDLPLNPKGTDFQRTVWKELQKIPFGKTTSYADLSKKLGDLKAIRAVGTANGRNPIAIIIPCHRVIGSDGSLRGYAGGLKRKQWLLEHESAQTSLF